MRALAERLGRWLELGDVVALHGPLGAGKTTFVQGLAAGLEVPADRHVASPTFALVSEHPGRVALAHADLYRLRAEGELAELGLDELPDRAAVAIEWANLFPSVLPPDHLVVDIAITGPEARVLTVHGTGPRGRGLVAAWLGADAYT
jgi:tRNA threonylcarbamoyladenosine biosynthesis protein TsaE